MTQSHKTEPIFVGRQDELDRFGDVLASPKGRAVLVVGPQGMGKTLLVNRMARMAEVHPDLKCGTVRYEVTKTDDVAGSMALMIDHAFEAANVGEKYLSGTGDQWRALFKAIGVVPVVGKAAEAIGELALSLKRDPAKDTRTQFIERLRFISEKMPDDGRAIFVIDPEKYMKDDSADAWRLVLRDMPDRVIFIFAQRPDDVLAKSAEFGALPNVVRIADGPLDVLDEQAVDDLVQARAADLSQPGTDVRVALARYNGHPYAVAAALGLLADGATIADLPADPTATGVAIPTGVAGAQWRRLCDEHKENAIKLFEAYAILEVAVPDDVVETVSGVGASTRKSLAANAFVAGLLRHEPDGTRIYHSLLADHIHEQISETDARAYHTRAIQEYRRRLTADAKHDALAAVRLPEHVLAVEGRKAFLIAFVNECTQPLYNLGLLDSALAMSHRALQDYVSPQSEDEAMIAGNLGHIYRIRGDLDEAVNMIGKALKISKKLGQLEGMATAYGNLGTIFQTRGDLDEAEKMHRNALEIEKKLGRLEGIAREYGNIGLLFQARGDLDEGEKMHRKALEIDKQLGLLGGMASHYGNLGLIFQTRGELDEAEKMHRNALEIEKKLGRLEGMAAEYGNIGLLFQARGDLNEAEKMHRKALKIDERLGRLEGIAGQFGNLGLILRRRGELDEAEKMLRKALEIEKKLGRLEGIANQYGNLGGIFRTRGNLDEARKLWSKSRDLYAQIGMPQMVEEVQGLLDDLPDAGEEGS